MRGAGPTYERVPLQVAVLLVLALSAHFAAPWLWNDYLYPSSTAAFPGSRIIYSLVPLLICGTLLLSRSRVQGMLRSKGLFLLGLICAPAGTLVAVATLSFSLHPGFFLVGIALFGAGRLFVFLVISGELVRLSLRAAVPVVAAALLLSGVWDAAAGVMPLWLAYAVAAAFEGLSVMLCKAIARSSCEEEPLAKSPDAGDGTAVLQDRSNTAASSSVGRGRLVPSNFLMAVGAFFMVFGFSGRYYEGGIEGSVAFFCSFAPLFVLGVWIAVRPKSFTLDPIYRVALILTAFGFVCIAFPSVVPPHIANMVVMGGSHCFVVIYWIGLCSACQRRPADAFETLLWGRMFASGGTLIGTVLALGMLFLQSFDSQVESFVAAIIAMLYMVVSLVVLRTLNCIVALPEGDEDAGEIERLSAAYGLTQREREVVSLLAKGRNAQYIQDKLFISKNTVKSHMKHIYAKLDVHTQQELLSLFEEAEDKRV